MVIHPPEESHSTRRPIPPVGAAWPSIHEPTPGHRASLARHRSRAGSGAWLAASRGGSGGIRLIEPKRPLAVEPPSRFVDIALARVAGVFARVGGTRSWEDSA